MIGADTVRAFERAFADYVGARYAIAMVNGTCTLHTALRALGVGRGDCVAVPPLTMSATTIAVLHAGGVPVFWDVDPRTWLMRPPNKSGLYDCLTTIPVSLYGLHYSATGRLIDDAAQTLRPHNSGVAFTSYSFQASKILPLGEGGMLVTNDEQLATRAREFSSLGYRMTVDQPRIDSKVIRDPNYNRHHSLGYNYRMAPMVAAEGLTCLRWADKWKAERREAAAMYRDAIEGCPWLTPQHVPEGWGHDYWTYAVALDDAQRWHQLAEAIERHGGELPYAAWKLTYQEPAFRYLTIPLGPSVAKYDGENETGVCPVAEDLQPRLMQFQTNRLDSAAKNAKALKLAIQEIGGG